MQSFLLEFHSIFRWVVILVALAALVLSILAATGSRPWDAIADRASLAFTIAMDVQFLIGALLWVSEQRWSSGDTFLTWGHPLLMFGAVAVAHVGRARAEKAPSDRVRGQQTAIFFGLSLLVVLVAIPLYAWPL